MNEELAQMIHSVAWLDAGLHIQTVLALLKLLSLTVNVAACLFQNTS